MGRKQYFNKFQDSYWFSSLRSTSSPVTFFVVSEDGECFLGMCFFPLGNTSHLPLTTASTLNIPATNLLLFGYGESQNRLRTNTSHVSHSSYQRMGGHNDICDVYDTTRNVIQQFSMIITNAVDI